MQYLALDLKMPWLWVFRLRPIPILPRPDRHPDIPGNAQWLSGESAGSWFAFIFEKDILKVTRYAPDGIIECSGFYKGAIEKTEGIQKLLIVDHPSNCEEINLTHFGQQFKFQRIEDYHYIDFINTSTKIPISEKLA